MQTNGLTIPNLFILYRKCCFTDPHVKLHSSWCKVTEGMSLTKQNIAKRKTTIFFGFAAVLSKLECNLSLKTWEGRNGCNGRLAVVLHRARFGKNNEKIRRVEVWFEWVGVTYWLARAYAELCNVAWCGYEVMQNAPLSFFYFHLNWSVGHLACILSTNVWPWTSSNKPISTKSSQKYHTRK